MYICIFSCIYSYTYMYMHIHIHICICMYIYIYIYDVVVCIHSLMLFGSSNNPFVTVYPSNFPCKLPREISAEQLQP